MTTGNTYVTKCRNSVSSNGHENKSTRQESCDDPIGFETDSSGEERINENTEHVETLEDSEDSDEDVTFICNDERTYIEDEKMFPTVHEEINISDDDSDDESPGKRRKLVRKPRTLIKPKTGQGSDSVAAQLLKVRPL